MFGDVWEILLVLGEYVLRFVYYFGSTLEEFYICFGDVGSIVGVC